MNRFGRIGLLGAFAGLVLAAPAMGADIVYEQNPAGASALGPFANFNHSQTQRVADNFMLATPAAVAQVAWWGWTYNNAANQQAGTANLLGFDVRILAADGAAGAPGTVVYQEAVPIGAVVVSNFAAGPISGQTYKFEANLASTVALAAGTEYWLAINAIVINPANNGDAFVWTEQGAGSGNPGDNDIALDGLGGSNPVDDVWVRTPFGNDMSFQILAVSDSDNDGLSDTDEAFFGSNPNDPDTDDDGLLDGTEVDLAAGGSCVNLLDPDTDDDTLLDGFEVNVLGTDPCQADTDGDGIPDAIDAQPLVSSNSNAQIAEAIRATADLILSFDLSSFSAPNANAAAARRNALANRLYASAFFAERGFDLPAALLILTVDLRIDSDPTPPDWMLDTPDRAVLNMFVDILIDLVIN